MRSYFGETLNRTAAFMFLPLLFFLFSSPNCLISFVLAAVFFEIFFRTSCLLFLVLALARISAAQVRASSHQKGKMMPGQAG
ncbi:hypothetical protein J3F83DRAFT_721453 [Trichoderma novae-zelandiae]